MDRCVVIRTILAVGLASASTSVLAQAQGVPNRGAGAQQAAPVTAPSAATKTVASLAAAGFVARGTLQKPTDLKQMIVIMQKDADVYFCPVWIDKLGVAADTCYRGT
jgi:hypothetical protein